MKKPVLALAPLVLTALATIHCGDDDAGPVAPLDNTPKGDAGGGDAAALDPNAGPSKLDVLFVVDNSSGMAVKQQFLADGVGRFLTAFASKDLHIGVISTSLGYGGDVCDARNPRSDDRGHLLNKSKGGSIVAGAENGFLTHAPGGDAAVLEAKAKDIILGVGENGCGLEAQLEAMYRFVSEPEPPLTIKKDDFQTAALDGTDYELLQQRKAFFRPDSAVAIVMVTDEDDGSLDPLAVGGFGYAFGSKNFPGSSVHRGVSQLGTTAPRGTSICATNPLSTDCTSCGFQTNCDTSTASCQAIRNDANCKESQDPPNSGQGFDGFYGPTKDDLNVRLFDMRRRFGVEPRFPVTRYVAAFTEKKVPSRAAAHVEKPGGSGQRIIAEYVQATDCTNPLFATGLPEKQGDNLCTLGENARSPSQVFFGLIGGAPPDLVRGTPDYRKLVGANPPADGSVSNDVELDPRMKQSIEARSGATGEWDTKGKDLQYACTFDLPTPVDCSADPFCDCSPQADNPPPLCDGTTLERGKAYPTFRELLLAQKLGERAVIASACELDAAKSYGTFFDAFAAKIKGASK